MKKLFIGSGIVALVATVVLYFVTAPTDEELIRQTIAESTQASKEGRAGGVLDYLSRSLTFNGIPVSDRAEIQKYVRLARPEVTFGKYKPVITVDDAVVVADVQVKMEFQSMQVDQTVLGVEVRLVRESGFRWLFLPSKKWRVTEVNAPDLAQFTGEF